MNKVIVIGSGISGMTCACALANKKYDVTVFEKHYVYGGYCQSFTRKGFKFGAAVPYAPTLAELTKLLSVFFTFFNKSVFRQL